MDEEPTVDPRGSRLAPTQEEIDAWAAREQARRQAWLQGPTQVEKDDWARRSRRRAALGLGDSCLAPTQEEIDAWAERERRRRQAWLEGPTEQEQREWVRRRSAREQTGAAETDAAPAPEEIEESARRENQRRREWLAGPTPHERSEWAARQTKGFLAGHLQLPAGFESEKELLSSLAREAESAAKGSWSALSRASSLVWSYLMRAGESVESDSSEPPRRSRVPY